MMLSTRKIALLLGVWLAAANALIWVAHGFNAWPAQVLILLSAMLLPGIAALRVLRVSFESHTEWLLYVIGLSVLLLMTSGLVVNQVLFALHVARPLELPGVLGGFDATVAACIVAGLCMNREPVYLKPFGLPRSATLTLGVMALCTPVLAAFGAFRLNNGGSALVAEIAICWAAMVIVWLFVLRQRQSDAALCWCIFMLGLAVLLMTALRGWDISGHDIMREFRVFTLTHDSARWNIAAYRDPYNACLSITILPEVLVRLSHTTGLVMFKFVLQALFALCPVVLYVLLRRFTGKFGALVGCVLFISYPTFINDSAMLTRQGVAYLFFALALLTALWPHRRAVAKPLFLLCALGVILSHYSTSYMFVAIFAIALACKWLLERLRHWPSRWRSDRFTVLAPDIVLFVFAATAIWYGPVTATSGGLTTTVIHSVAGLPHMLSADNKSSDTSAALLLSSHKTQTDIFQSYLAQTPHDGTAAARAAAYEPQLTEDNIPITTLGKRLGKAGIGPDATAGWRQNFAKLLQLLAGLSVAYALYRCVTYFTFSRGRKKHRALPFDLACLSLAGIVILVSMVALPTLSLNYGVLRTFQQLLIFLTVPIVVTLQAAARFMHTHTRRAVAAGSALAIFLLFTGLVAQLLGGVTAPLTLNNYGLYYGLYYTTKADTTAYAWMETHMPRTANVQASGYFRATMHDPYYPFAALGILPTQKAAGSYAYLDQAQLVAHKLYVNYSGSPLILTFPTAYYDDWTNRIYSNGMTGVFH